MSTRGTLALALFVFAPLARAQGLWPPPPVPPGNPTTAGKVLLGKALFWDEQLSSTRTVACGTCHAMAAGGSDPRAAQAVHPGPDGVFGTADDIHGSPGVAQQDAAGHLVASTTFGIRPQVTGRKAPSMINAAYQGELFWDGRASGTFRDPVSGAILLQTGGALESQAAGPPANAVEMAHLGRTWTDIAQDLANLRPLALADRLPPALQAFVAGQTYAALFQQVYGSPGVTPERIVFAIAAYERELVADQSPFDRWLAGLGPLGSQAQRGHTLFQGLCTTCHLDIGQQVRFTGPVMLEYRNIGVRPLAEDPGRFTVTNQPLDQGRFKVPVLRNVELRAPYFHTGSAATLRDVVDFYARGGDFHQNQDPLVASIPGQLTTADRADLVAFLQTLTDPRVAAGQPPFDRPRLASEAGRLPTVFGTGTAGTGGFAPSAVAPSMPFAGNPRFQIGVDRTLPAAFHLLALDLAASQTPTIVLGQNVYLGMTPSLVLVGMPALTSGTGPGGGHGHAVLAIPGRPGIVGASFYGQWIVVDGGGPNGIATSSAFGFTVF